MNTLSSWLILIALTALITAVVASGVAAMIASNAAHKGDTIEAINAKFASDLFRLIVAGPIMIIAVSLVMGFARPSAYPEGERIGLPRSPQNTNE